MRASGVVALLLVAALATSAAGPPPVPTKQIVALRGIKMYLESYGQGPPLLLLHGGAGNGLQFSEQVPLFSKEYRCIVPDMCAQGRTTDRPGPLSYHAMAEDVVTLMDSLKIPAADLMGWSDGGNIGLYIAIHHPTRLKHLVIFGANLNPQGLNAADVAWNDTATVAAFGDGMKEGWTKLSPEPAHYHDAMQKIIDLWRTQPQMTAKDLAKIKTKTFVCAGENDLIRRAHTEAIAKGIAGSELWIVPGGSHSVMIENAALVNPRVLDFLGK